MSIIRLPLGQWQNKMSFPDAAKKPCFGRNETTGDFVEQDAEQHHRVHVPRPRGQGGGELGEEPWGSLDGNSGAGGANIFEFAHFQNMVNTQVLEQGLQVVGGPVEAVTLPFLLKNLEADAVVIKLDIQGFECRVLRHLEKFTRFQNVPYIFMEWNKLGSSELCPDLLSFISLMESQGYIARDAASGDLLPERCLQMPLDNVLWSHTSAKSLWEREVVQDCRMVPVVRMGDKVLRKEEIDALGGLEGFLKDQQWQPQKLH